MLSVDYTNSMEQNPYREANSRSANQEILRLVRSPRFHFRIDKNPPLVLSWVRWIESCPYTLFWKSNLEAEIRNKTRSINISLFAFSGYKDQHFVRFQFFTATSKKMAVFWDDAPWSLVEVDRRFQRCLLPPSSGPSKIPQRGNIFKLFRSITWTKIICRNSVFWFYKVQK
jgi:hypothetical protein